MAQGKTNGAIAVSLTLTERAVEKHANSIFGKLGLSAERDINRRVSAVLLYLGRQPALRRIREPRAPGPPGTVGWGQPEQSVRVEHHRHAKAHTVVAGRVRRKADDAQLDGVSPTPLVERQLIADREPELLGESRAQRDFVGRGWQASLDHSRADRC